VKKHLNVILTVFVFLILLGWIVKLHSDIADVKKTMAGYKNARDQTSKNLELSENEISKLKKALKLSNDRLKNLQDVSNQLEKEARQDRVVGGDNLEDQENELDRWFGAIEKVKNFAKYHPNYVIPEFKFLAAKHWLAVTQDGRMESEADYRKALAGLRESAKGIVISMLAQGVKDYTGANNGNPPKRLEDISNYLSADLDPGILERYMTNPSGVIDGYSSGDRFHWIIKEAMPSCDDIWDSGFYVNDLGGTATLGVNYTAGDKVQEAITKYRNAYGVEPTSVDQIREYFDDNLKQEVLKDKIGKIFKSLLDK
jgi:tetratricopeptide (TPR) repeat protein